MRIKAILSAAVLAGAGLAALPLTAAHAATASTSTAGTAISSTSVSLPLSTYFQMAVDNTHHHLFFSQGNPAQNGILVTDFSGATVATIPDQTGVMGITLSPDGGTLYAALSGLHEITAISTATLQPTAVYSLGDDNTPLSVAVQSGRLFVSYDNDNNPSHTGLIGYFNLSAAGPVLETSPTLEDPPASGTWLVTPLIAADPTGLGNVLVAMQPTTDPAYTATFNTATSPVQIRASRWAIVGGQYNCGQVVDLAVAPGGAQFVPACWGDTTQNYRYSTANLIAQGSYATAWNTDAVAVAPGTGLVATGVDSALLTPSSSPDIFVYGPDGGQAQDVLSAGSWGIAPRGLGLSADGSRLFAVTAGATALSTVTGGFQLYSYTLPVTKVTPALSISASPAAATWQPVVHLTVHLGPTDGNRTVSVYAKPAGSTKQTLLKTAAVSTAGTLTLSYPAPHTTTFSAVFAGDAGTTARTATATTTVAARVTVNATGYYASKRIGAVTYRVYHHTAKLAAAITVAPDKAGHCVKLQVQEYAKGTWHSSLTGCGKLNSRSQAAAVLVLTHASLGPYYRARVEYLAGTDPTNASAYSAWQYFIVAK